MGRRRTVDSTTAYRPITPGSPRHIDRLDHDRRAYAYPELWADILAQTDENPGSWNSPGSLHLHPSDGPR